MNDQHTERLWEMMREMYFRCKALIILQEEIDPEFETFLQPVMEFRHALDHIFRSTSVAEEGSSRDHQVEHLRKALGHIMRAFYDLADYITIVIKQKTIRLLGKYSPEVISRSLPEYYTGIRPRIDELSREIAQLRTRKGMEDIELLPDMERYESAINELLDFLSRAEQALPALEASRATSHRRRVARSVFLALFSALAGALLTWLLVNLAS